MALVPKKTLVFDTRAGTRLEVAYDTSSPIIGAVDEAAAMRASYSPQVVFRTNGPRKSYNCHGLTFASSRGWVPDTDVRTILVEDDYVQVARDQVKAGDVILYVSSKGDVEHSGIVLKFDPASALIPPVVLSKWGQMDEAIHPANRCEYDFSRVEYWRVSK